MRLLAALLALAGLLASESVARAEPPALAVGSKRFTESYILAEIVKQTAEAVGEARVVHKEGLGSTGIVEAALESGSIDLYVEYTGTIQREILRSAGSTSLDELDRALAPRGLAASVPLGFEDTYALALTEARAAALGIRTIADLARHPTLRLGLSHEFLERADGWPALEAAYRLPVGRPRGLEHGLAYEALAAGEVDVIDVYSTDAKIERYALRVIEDERHFFPEYAAVLFHRRDLPARMPRTWAALEALRGRIDAPHMIAMNADAEVRGAPFAAIAARFLSGARAPRAEDASEPRAGDAPPAARRGLLQLLFGPDLARLALQHLWLVFVSLTVAVAIGVPLGVVATTSPRIGAWILAAVGVVQTVPSLALLAFLIPVLHRIGTAPTLVALFLYSLLPIVRSTHAGLADIAPSLRESAVALGLPPLARLRLVELPLAARSILSGIKTAAVIDVGTATIAAFVGAGGFGERIASGLALNDGAMLLAGAIPAAVLALLVQGVFEGIERLVVSPGMRGWRG